MNTPLSQVTIRQLFAFLALVALVVAIVLALKSDRHHYAQAERQACAAGLTSACPTSP